MTAGKDFFDDIKANGMEAMKKYENDERTGLAESDLSREGRFVPCYKGPGKMGTGLFRFLTDPKPGAVREAHEACASCLTHASRSKVLKLSTMHSDAMWRNFRS